MSGAPAIYVINRAADEARLSAFSAAAAALDLVFTRIEAIDGHDPQTPLFLYRNLLADTFWGGPGIKPGAFACFLSHAAAWRRMLADGHETALIMEDDAALSVPPASIAAPERFDVVFAGARLNDWRGAADETEPLSAALARMASSGRAPAAAGLAKGPGAEAYLVSRAGAARLLALLARDRVRAGVDWMMLGWATPEAARPGWSEFAHLPTGPLDAFVAAPIVELAKSSS